MTTAPAPAAVIRAALVFHQKYHEVKCNQCGDHGVIEFATVWIDDPSAEWIAQNPWSRRVRLRDGRELHESGYRSLVLCKCRREMAAEVNSSRTRERGAKDLTERGREQTWATWDFKRTDLTSLAPGPEHQVVPSALMGWVPASGDVLFTGPRRTGKTHAMNAMAHTILKKGIACIVVNLTDLLARERRQDGTRPIDNAIAAPVLFVDDLGTSRLTQWELEVIYRLVDRRLEEKRATCWATNLELAKLWAYFAMPGDPHGHENALRIRARLGDACKWIYRFDRAEHR